MKIRILSGAALIAIVAVLLTVQLYAPVVLVAAAALLGMMGVYEMLYSTGLCQNKWMVALGLLPAAVVPFVMQGYIAVSLSLVYTVYMVLVFAFVLKFHAKLQMSGIVSALVFPILLSYGFGSVVFVAQHENAGMFYLLAVLCWSAIADTGAYFVGVLFGKHKMAKVISPKKSWEGFVGGMVFGILFAFLLCLLYEKVLGYEVNTLLMLCITPIFVAIGVMGDLSASIIKRKCQIKDFGHLIPGHGGILDRFDSILMIAPLFAQVIANITLIK